MPHIITGKTYADVYRQALDLVVNKPDYVCKPRGFTINECLNVILEIDDPTSCLFENKIRSTPISYLKKELILYLSGTRDAKSFAMASKFWNRCKNEDDTINSAYGELIFKRSLPKSNQVINNELCNTQFDWVVQSLKKDKDSRQAILFYNRPEFQDLSTKDFVCTLSQAFHIRDNKLHTTVTMRSNDIYRGNPTDIPFFALVQALVLNELKNTVYPNIELGKLVYIGHSLHLYHELISSVSDIEIANLMLETPFNPKPMPMPKTSKVICHPIFTKLAEIAIDGQDKFQKACFAVNLSEDDQDFEFLNWVLDRA